MAPICRDCKHMITVAIKRKDTSPIFSICMHPEAQLVDGAHPSCGTERSASDPSDFICGPHGRLFERRT